MQKKKLNAKAKSFKVKNFVKNPGLKEEDFPTLGETSQQPTRPQPKQGRGQKKYQQMDPKPSSNYKQSSYKNDNYYNDRDARPKPRYNDHRPKNQKKQKYKEYKQPKNEKKSNNRYKKPKKDYRDSYYDDYSDYSRDRSDSRYSKDYDDYYYEDDRDYYKRSNKGRRRSRSYDSYNDYYYDRSYSRSPRKKKQANRGKYDDYGKGKKKYQEVGAGASRKNESKRIKEDYSRGNGGYGYKDRKRGENKKNDYASYDNRDNKRRDNEPRKQRYDAHKKKENQSERYQEPRHEHKSKHQGQKPAKKEFKALGSKTMQQTQKKMDSNPDAQTEESARLKRYFTYVNQDERKPNLKNYQLKANKIKVIMIAEKPSIADIIAKSLSNNM